MTIRHLAGRVMARQADYKRKRLKNQEGGGHTDAVDEQVGQGCLPGRF
jgi:hypothetical protein